MDAFSVLQFKVEVSDQSSPEKTASSNVQVTFVRDKMPRFDNLPKVQEVSENVRNNSLIYSVKGKDDDKQVGQVYCHLFSRTMHLI